jgi:hypothetical protein
MKRRKDKRQRLSDRIVTLPDEPYPFLEDELIETFLSRRPRTFDPSNLILSYCAPFVCIPDRSRRWAYVRSDLARPVGKAAKALKLLASLGLVKTAPRWYTNHYHILGISQPKRRMDLDSIRRDSKWLDFAARRKRSGDQLPRLWEMVKAEVPSLKKWANDPYRRLDYTKSRYKDTKRYSNRFIQALVYSSPDFYKSNLYARGGAHYLMPKAELHRLQDIRDAAIRHALRNLQMSKQEYESRYHQPAPRCAFDELVNSRWRRLAYSYQTFRK